MLYAFGVGEAPISVSGDRRGRRRLGHTIRAVGAVTEALCALEPATHIGVRGPFGNSWPLAEAEGRDVVVVAGGIGLAPLRPAIYHLLAKRERYGRLARLRRARARRGALHRPSSSAGAGAFDVAHDRGQRAEPGRGRVGVVTTLIPARGFDARTTAMVCGPEVMMRFAARRCATRGSAGRSGLARAQHEVRAWATAATASSGQLFVCKDGPVFPLGRIER